MPCKISFALGQTVPATANPSRARTPVTVNMYREAIGKALAIHPQRCVEMVIFEFRSVIVRVATLLYAIPTEHMRTESPIPQISVVQQI
mmetsp:Transcript_31505/g.61880  ORF Transcript_31505/g.61880 Transcript_31505/m.61880 type:complete len:89 (-) Transcript_31505:245-511(-)